MSARGFAHRPGYYVKLVWQPPDSGSLRTVSLRQSGQSRSGRPEPGMGLADEVQPCWAGRGTRPGAVFKAQALQGRTRMGFADTGTTWTDNRFRSAFGLLTRPFGTVRLAGRSMPSTRATTAATSAMNMMTGVGRRCWRRSANGVNLPGWSSFFMCRACARIATSSGSSRDSARRSSSWNCEHIGNHARIVARYPLCLNLAPWCVDSF